MAARTALITGGGGDLALAVRTCLLAEGWTVHAPNRQEMDVTSTAAVTAFFTGLGPLDLLINNAGVIADSPMLLARPDQWESVLAVNLDGAFRCTRAALKGMVKQRQGHIINIGSFAALHGTEGQSSYAAAKAGLIALTQSVALEYGPRNLRCNCVLPGFLETRMTQAALSRRRPQILESHALGRLNTVADAARFIVQLDSFNHVSGQVFQLDSRVRKHG